MTKPFKSALCGLAILAFFDGYLWFLIFASAPDGVSTYYFLDVGQGDAALLIFPGNVKMLVDSGPDASAVNRLSEILPVHDRYIDLVVMTHPEQDHVGGFPEIFRSYKAGAFLGNGRKSEIGAYRGLMEELRSARVPYIGLRAGDRVRYGGINVAVLSPDEASLKSGKLNNTSLVLMVEDNGARTLLTGDIGSEIESVLAGQYDLDADVLKVPHHGSRFSTSAAFLAEISPKISVIGVGKNRYGHPTPSALVRLADVGSLVYRTDRDGTVALRLVNGKINIFKKPPVF